MIRQTAHDLRNQREIAAAIVATVPRLRLIESDDLALIDYAVLLDGVHVGWMETKHRDYTLDTMGRFSPSGVMLDATKWDGGSRLTASGEPCLFIVRDLDMNIYWALMHEWEPLHRGNGGRTDRGDPLDIDKVVYIPARLFRPLGEMSDDRQRQRNRTS